ncbi:MAG TPA: hypothetical protein VNM69_00220 [Bacillus sp. (in: firmicutes)]|uniref:hypothetical protein n=1 Tax=Bacillus litorisediminis TaxID=2922713 RepID=UPI001FAC191F|nr:hypothetical protein [Bacillus litorisediminis]HWO74322.1 hypothetical protein [Bacillus sp. (in: firmicutes)]
MKKIIIGTLITILLALTVYILWYTFPTQHIKTFEGVSFQLESEAEAEKVNIHINGVVQRSLNGQRTFEGTIDIEGEVLPVPEDQRKVVVRFLENGLGSIIYVGYKEDGKPYTYSYGTMFINKNLSKLTILKGDWTAANGLIISAPAGDRTEAVQISNELMREFLDGKSLR